MKKIIFSIFALFLIAGSGSCQSKMDNEEEMKALSDKVFEVYNTGNVSLYDEILSSKIVNRTNFNPEEIIGIEASKEGVKELRSQYPDLNLTRNELIIQGDKMAATWTLTGTDTGPGGDIPPTGKKLNISGVRITHVVDGKIIESWNVYNNGGAAIQLGYTLTPPETQNEQ